eukprot:15479994-Alexandrium_andersonii.AAC.1
MPWATTSSPCPWPRARMASSAWPLRPSGMHFLEGNGRAVLQPVAPCPLLGVGQGSRPGSSRCCAVAQGHGGSPGPELRRGRAGPERRRVPPELAGVAVGGRLD